MVTHKTISHSLLAFVNNISLSTHENLQAAKEKASIPTKSHSSAATDVKKHQACVSELDQQILKQHHLPLDCWEDWWRAQTMLRWSTETWMDTIRKTALRKLGQVITLNTSHCRHRHDVRRRREAVTGKAYDSFLSLSHFSVVLPSKQINAVAQEGYYSPFSLRELLPFFWSSSRLKLLHLPSASWTAEFKEDCQDIPGGAKNSLLCRAGGHRMRCSLSWATWKSTMCTKHKGRGFFQLLRKNPSLHDPGTQ